MTSGQSREWGKRLDSATSSTPRSRERAALSDEELYREFIGGDLESFEALFRRYKQALMGYCMKRMGDEDLANDIVQNTFFRIWRNREKFNPEQKFVSWFWVIASNTYKNAVRDKSRRRERLFSEFTEEQQIILDKPTHLSGPEESLERKETRALVWKAIEMLRPHHKAVLVLREIEDHTYEYIGEERGIGVGTIKSQLSRARAAFRQNYLTLSEEING